MSEVLASLYQKGNIKPRLDYYYGRPALYSKISEHMIEICLVGNVTIQGKLYLPDGEHVTPLKGFTFAATNFPSASECVGLLFCRGWNKTIQDYTKKVEIWIEKDSYSITDPAYKDGEEYFPNG